MLPNNANDTTTLKYITQQDIDSLTKDSPIALLNALYQCQDFVFVDSTHNPSLSDSNITKTFGYKSSFYLSFIANKDSLSNEYLQARKALYKTYQLIKQEQAEELQKQQQELEQELQGLDSKERESKLQELQREQERELREKQRQVRTNKRNANNTNNLILESKDKNNIIIFLDSANSLSNLIHIHNERIDIFTKDSTRLDIQELESLINKYNDSFRDFNNTESNPTYNTQSDNDNIESKTNNPESNNPESKLTLDSLHSANTQIFLYSQLLLGSSESPNNPLFFGELDKEGVFRESKPIYHLIGEIDYDSKDSKESFTQTLQVFLGSNTLTLLHYSLLDSSLNIKLECNSKESKAILEREQIQREQIQRDSNSIDSLTSTAMLHPILEDDEIKCPHNGVVQLKSNKGKPFTSKGIPMILESDLLNAPIIGCANNILTSDSKTFSTNQCIIPKNKAIHAS